MPNLKLIIVVPGMLLLLLAPSLGQCEDAPAAGPDSIEIPAIHSNLVVRDGQLAMIDSTGSVVPLQYQPGNYTLAHMRAQPVGADSGVVFDFHNAELNGEIVYGLIEPPERVKYSYPVYADHSVIKGGRAELNILQSLSGLYDFVGWQESGELELGYRVVTDSGRFVYDGKIRLAGTGPFVVDTSIIEGPFINLITDTSAVVSFETNYPLVACVMVAGSTFADERPETHHEISLNGLAPDTEYDYAVGYGNHRDTYTFRTAPSPGSRLPFTFAFASDSRANYGGGERDLYGVNAYIVKRVAAACHREGARFLQFTGDLIDGYSTDIAETQLEYANWKQTVAPFAAHLPFIAVPGNHEGIFFKFREGKSYARIDKFPFATHSTEVIFAQNFVNPRNGPLSEDGSKYDPDPNRIDFPPYEETVFYYLYDNVAMVCLSSNYWFAYRRSAAHTGGNIQSYIMDNQLAWLKETLAILDGDDNIDHIFITNHTPIFPNGGNVYKDMWFDGDNSFRPVIAGQPVEKGIIERRDELLEIMINQSPKVVAVLTGDEHNYCTMRVTANMPMYPDDWAGERLVLTRPFWQINNGAAGAPYYGQEKTPWTDHVRMFSTQYAVVFIHVNGESIRVEVLNPDTLELLDEFTM